MMRLLLLLFFSVGLLLFLSWQFPYVAETTDQKIRITYLVLMLMIMGSGSGLLLRMRSGEAIRNAVLWLGIILALILGYSYRDQIRHSRIYGELIPSRIQVSDDGALNIHMSADGHFHMEAEINGAFVKFLVDTGASDIVLSPRAAAAAGFDVTTLDYSRTYNTANGVGSGAPVILGEMNVGSISFHELPASVNSAEMDESLLGMAFLRQFSSYTVDGDHLTLYP
jgi:aspartyl protease family protein